MSRRILILGLLALAPLAGCNLLDRESDPSQAPDSAAVADSLSPADSAAPTDTAAPGDTAAAQGVPAAEPDPVVQVPGALAPGGGSAPDTTAAATDSVIAALQRRVSQLEARNDSLSNTVLGLIAIQGSQPRGRTAASDSANTAEEILGRGAQEVRNWGFRIFVTILFLVFVAGVIRGLVWVLDKLAERNAKRRLFFKRLVPVSRILLWALAVPFAALVILNIDAQGLVAAGAAVGVAVGFAAQDILKNIFGGIIVLFDQPFQVGDKISVHGTYGEVVNIGLRSTRLVTPDDNLVTVPNAQVVGDQVANANAGELNCQVVTDLYLPGWANEALAKRLAFEAAASSKYVYLNKPIVVLVKDEFQETFILHIKVKAYVLDPRHEFAFMSDVTERARRAFRDAGLIGPMHGVRAYVDLERFPEVMTPPEPNPTPGEEGP
ncbi:MAG TPA: mechanosensitive ion channel domain-containing protein [Longimicrobiales bacterium]|nr:mechanosensitive ion channel domain-containing protein [Longimicrobiales bacterium]